ncbi:LLM class flavin-dependent oxidoreductase [Nocardia takedensis]|uniref:LLM class flavin-dependent oxidoreductase n=1 Tax=Nocardia takedensis TaxID=259390 RepID=UPI0002F0BD02|nr:LLM class flavin-dependent oxidoreductase [Nocardia takedensis]
MVERSRNRPWLSPPRWAPARPPNRGPTPRTAAGVSPQGRDFAAANADAIFSPYGDLPKATEFYRDIKSRGGRGPDIDPDPQAPPIIQGRAFVHQDRFATVERLRQVAEAKKLTLREVVIDQFERGPLVGTPTSVADQIASFVAEDGSDGFILGSHLVPWGLDEFVDRVVPLLQDRGVLRADYSGATLRDNFGLRPLAPVHA